MFPNEKITGYSDKIIRFNILTVKHFPQQAVIQKKEYASVSS